MKSFLFPRRSPTPPLCSDQGSVMIMMMMMMMMRLLNKMMRMIMRMSMMKANLVGDIV